MQSALFYFFLLSKLYLKRQFVGEFYDNDIHLLVIAQQKHCVQFKM